MAEQKTQKIEREYVIPLRRHWMNSPSYKRTGKAIKAIKQFLARHMKVPDRDLRKIKLDMYLNNDIWFRGMKHPPAKVKVKAVKEGDVVRVYFVETPAHIKFLKAKHEKFHRKGEKKAEEKKEEIPAEKEEKKDEQEKEQSVAEQHVKEAELKVKEQRHTTSVKEPIVHRKALQK